MAWPIQGTSEWEDAFGQLPIEVGVGDGGFGEPVRCDHLVSQALRLSWVIR